MSRPPDFIGVGTLDAGTAWWHDMLVRHPGVEPRRRRDRDMHFFDQFCGREMSDADVAAYHASFRARDGRIDGEWTERYMYDAWTPPLLQRAAPDAKLLVLLCDPIERYRRRITRERIRAIGGVAELNMADAAGRGRYVLQLRRLHELYDPDRILLLQYEKCRADPLGEYARTLRFLGLDKTFVPRKLLRQAERGFGPRLPSRLLRAVGVPPGMATRVGWKLTRRMLSQPEPAPLWPDIEAALHEEFDGEVRALQEMLPEFDAGVWPNFAGLAERAVAPTPASPG
jgi:hypothetical protein